MIKRIHHKFSNEFRKLVDLTSVGNNFSIIRKVENN